MKIVKILNNNAVVSLMEDQTEVICFGKGIAFQRKVGEEIDEAQVDKKFVLENPDLQGKYQQIVTAIPEEYVSVAYKIIKDIKKNLGKYLSDSIYISLTDHIYAAIQRKKQGISLTNTMLWDIKRFYPTEFKLGKEAVALIDTTFDVRLPEDEAGFIAFHIVNAELGEDGDNTYEMTKMMTEVLNVVKYHFHISFDEESVYYYRFITHLKFLVQRLLKGNLHETDVEDTLFQTIKVAYPASFDCASKINEFLTKNYQLPLSYEEMSYLTIHLDRLVYKTS